MLGTCGVEIDSSDGALGIAPRFGKSRLPSIASMSFMDGNAGMFRASTLKVGKSLRLVVGSDMTGAFNLCGATTSATVTLPISLNADDSSLL